MSSSNSRKKNTRFYWAELGFIGLGLLGLNPNLIGELMGGNSESAKAVREATKAITEDLIERTKTSVGNNILSPHQLAPPNTGMGQIGYVQPASYANVLPPAIMYGNQIYYSQQYYVPQNSPYPQPSQPPTQHQAFNYQESTAQIANMISDAARRLAFDQSASQQSSSQQNGQFWGSNQDSTRQTPANTVPPANYPNLADQSYMAQMPGNSGPQISTNMVKGYDSNYPSASNSGLNNASRNTAFPSTSSYGYQQNQDRNSGLNQSNTRSASTRNTQLNNNAYGQQNTQNPPQQFSQQYGIIR